MELKSYWEIFLKRRRLFLATVFLIPFFAYIFTKLISPIYSSDAKIWIRQNPTKSKFLSGVPTDFGKADFTDSDNSMPTIESMLESEDVVGKVISGLGLKNRKGVLFNKDDFLDPGVLSLIRQKKGLAIENVSDSDVFKIVGYSADPAEAKEIANTTLNKFKEKYASLYRDLAKEAADIIRKRIEQVDVQAAKAEKELTDYEIKSRYYSKDQTTTLITVLASLETKITDDERTIAVDRETLKSIKRALDEQPEFKESSKSLEVNPVIKEAKQDLLDLYVSLAKTSVEKTPEHPDVKLLLAQIESAKETIKNEVERTLSTTTIQRNSYYDDLITKYGDTEIDIVSKTAEKRTLLNQIDEKNKVLASIAQLDDEFNRLSSEVEAIQKVKSTLREELEGAISAQTLDINNILVLQNPTISSNIKDNLYFPPSGKAILVIATILSTFIGTFFVFLSEYLDETVQNADELKTITDQKIISLVPAVDRKFMNSFEQMIHNTPFVEGVQNLVKHFTLNADMKRPLSIALVSPSAGDGKSSLTALMGALFALQGKKVIILDGDIKKPFQHKIFGINNSSGLTDCLKGSSEIARAIVSSPVPNLKLLPAGTCNKDFICVSRENIKEVLTDSAAAGFEVALIDTQSFDLGPDSLMMSMAADYVIMIVAEGETEKKHVVDFMESLKSLNIGITCMVLNKKRKV